ncbi:MAG: LysM peptidoglycan-binding domain-containing protein [Candidatus Poribacteria bacterium]|nr:LysM peptidoglycan-binding domain-containing protein [Candidatus Poribacteria bacterium]
MKAMKSAVSLGLILYLCVSLSGVLLVLDASAKITPKETDEPTGFYTIKKGDTLWHLAKKYRNDPLLWREFEKYNIFTNPHRIYPKEKLQVSAMWGFPGVPMPEPEPPEMVVEMATKAHIDMLKAQLDSHAMGVSESLGHIDEEIHEMHGEIHGIQDSLAGLKSAMDMGGESLASVSMNAMENKNAIAGLNESVMALSEGLNAHVMEMEKGHMEHVEHIDGHLDKIEQTLADMKAVQDETAGKVESILNPPKMKSKKRPIAFLTALVGGAAWVAMNSLGDRE